MSMLHLCLLFSSALFCIGLVTALSRSNTILVLLGIELMLNAANVNFIAFWKFNPATTATASANGVIFVLFSIAVAAATRRPLETWRCPACGCLQPRLDG